jgi:Putative restriction endonuclease
VLPFAPQKRRARAETALDLRQLFTAALSFTGNGFADPVNRARRADHRGQHDQPAEDHIVRLYGATWDDYQRLLAIRGDHSAPRISFLEGEIESQASSRCVECIVSPSRSHESIKSRIGRLVEVWCLERGVEFSTYGSWTLKNKRSQRGAEPDECYVFGQVANPKRPDLAIEVVWTSGGLDKLEIYRKQTASNNRAMPHLFRPDCAPREPLLAPRRTRHRAWDCVRRRDRPWADEVWNGRAATERKRGRRPCELARAHLPAVSPCQVNDARSLDAERCRRRPLRLW